MKKREINDIFVSKERKNCKILFMEKRHFYKMYKYLDKILFSSIFFLNSMKSINTIYGKLISNINVTQIKLDHRKKNYFSLSPANGNFPNL